MPLSHPAVDHRADLEALAEAVEHLGRRGEGWSAPLSDNALAFLLDALGDAVVIRDDDDRPIFANRSAEAFGALPPAPDADLELLELEGERYERRSHAFITEGAVLRVEVIRRR